MDNMIYTIAYWLRGRVKSTTIIKFSLYMLFVGCFTSVLFWSVIPVVIVLVFNQGVSHVLEFLYAMNEEQV